MGLTPRSGLYVQVDLGLIDSVALHDFADALFPHAPAAISTSTDPAIVAIWPDVVQSMLVNLWGALLVQQPEGVTRDVTVTLLERWSRWSGTRGEFARLFREHFCEGDDQQVVGWLERYGKLRQVKTAAAVRQQRRRQRLKEEADRRNAAESSARHAPVTRDVTPHVTRDVTPDVALPPRDSHRDVTQKSHPQKERERESKRETTALTTTATEDRRPIAARSAFGELDHSNPPGDIFPPVAESPPVPGPTAPQPATTPTTETAPHKPPTEGAVAVLGAIPGDSGPVPPPLAQSFGVDVTVPDWIPPDTGDMSPSEIAGLNGPPMDRPEDYKWRVDVLWERWRRIIGEIDYSMFRKKLGPASKDYTIAQLWYALDVLKEGRMFREGDERRWLNFQHFLAELRFFIRLGAMPVYDATMTPTERGWYGPHYAPPIKGRR